MKLLLLNPNSSQSVTERIAEEAEKFQRPDLEIEVRTVRAGPPVVETAADELLAGYGVLQELRRLEDQFDAAVICCFADPGLLAAREELKIPVVGICEAALHMGRLHGSRFSVLSSCGSADISAFHETIGRCGFREGMASVRYLGSGVNGVPRLPSEAAKELIRRCFEEDGANAVILGCAAFSGWGEPLSQEFGRLVSDGVGDGAALAEMLVKRRIASMRPNSNEHSGAKR